MGRMTGSGESSGHQPGDDIGEDSSVDSFLRDVAHAPLLTVDQVKGRTRPGLVGDLVAGRSVAP